MSETGYDGLYPKDGCLAVQYAESDDLSLVAQAPNASSIEKTNKEHWHVHYDGFAKSIMKAHGFHDRKKIPKFL